MPQTLAGQNAKSIGVNFQLAKVKVGSATFTATSVADTLAHGLGAAPDFVLITGSGETAGTTYKWTSDTTTLTLTRATTVGAETWSYFLAILT